MVGMREALAFFAPTLPTLAFSAWDCLPYDRVSPHGDVVSRRLEPLSKLAAPAAGTSQGELVVVTTVNSLLQRVAPRMIFSAARFAVSKIARDSCRERLCPFVLLSFVSYSL